MANPELKNASSSIQNASSSILRDTKQMGEKMVDEASPRVRETIDQVSEVASDLYGKASSWLESGNNKNYAFIGLAATLGVVGFFIGRGLRSDSTEF
jgi:ElaB/YqjD/DUF883 family membrane-anchored ribosome-binding protein